MYWYCNCEYGILMADHNIIPELQEICISLFLKRVILLDTFKVLDSERSDERFEFSIVC